jgi:2-oxoglutarate ferredoxin oxidoreductase subunit alpha
MTTHTPSVEEKSSVTILFAGDSGDGIQLTGTQFTNTAALLGNDISTFPNFPAEIRAPQGTIAGVSGFQLHFGSVEINSPGDQADVLVVMNAAALKANLKQLKPGGIIIANTDGFDAKNLKLAKIEEQNNPLINNSLAQYQVVKVDISKLTRECLKDTGLGTKEMDRSKNMYVLGLIYWIYNRPLTHSEKFIEQKFKNKPDLLAANLKALYAGYNFGETSELFNARYSVKKANLQQGVYRNIMGNQATAIGLIAAAQKSGLSLFYGSYPITPASDILHELSRNKNFGVKTFQAEDEIAAITAAIGASFGGTLAVTGSSGPGIALKTEAIGLAAMLELPLVILNVQRGGPSTGLPTKTEQADLMQAVYGRNGECPVPVIAAYSPSDCFTTAFEACRIALEHMTPVFFLSDGYIANGSEPWMFPNENEIENISAKFAEYEDGKIFLPYDRDEKLARPWAIPGVAGLEHRIGGIEKEHLTGNISYDPENHEFMVKLRQSKVDKIANFVPKQTFDSGDENDDILVLAWGSTYGAIRTAVRNLRQQGIKVAHCQVKYIHPLPINLGEILAKFDKVIIPEMNNGQLSKIIQSTYLKEVVEFHKIKGMPFTVEEISNKILSIH